MRSRGTTTPRGFGARRRMAVGAVGLAVGLVGSVGLVGLAACSGESRPTPSTTWTPLPQYPSPTPTPTPTQSPTPTDPAAVAPERPGAMDTVDTAGAEAVATYFVELFPYMFATGDKEAFGALSHPDCIYCTNVLAGAEELSTGGHHAQGGLEEVTSVQGLEVDPGKWWTVDLEVTQQPSQTVTADGQVVAETSETVRYHIDMAVVRENTSWLVREATVTELSRGA